MDNRPNIPALESVEVDADSPCNPRDLFIGMLCIAFFAGIGGCYFYIRTPDPWKTIVLCIFVVGALVTLGFSLRALLRHFHWKTDSTGITATGLFGRTRSVSWHEVRDLVIERGGYTRIPVSLLSPEPTQTPQAFIDPDVTAPDAIDGRFFTEISKWRDIKETSDGYLRCLKLVTASGELRLPNVNKLNASVLQRLSIHNRPDTNPVLKDVLSYWSPVPDNVPREIEWYNLKPESRLSAFIPVLFFCSGIVILVTFLRNPRGHLDLYNYIGPSMATWAAVMEFVILFAPEIARHVIVREDSISIDKLRSSSTVPWSECEFVEYGSGCSMTIKWGDDEHRETATIPNLHNDSSAPRLLLSIIRHLREAGQAAPIPEALRDTIKLDLDDTRI